MNALNILQEKFIGQALPVFIPNGNGHKIIVDKHNFDAVNGYILEGNGKIQLCKVIGVVYTTKMYKGEKLITNDYPHFEFIFQGGMRLGIGFY